MMMMMNSRRMSLRHKRTRSRARPLERLQWTRDVHLARVTRARYVPARVCARARECSSFSSLDLTSEKKTDAKIKEKEALFDAN